MAKVVHLDGAFVGITESGKKDENGNVIAEKSVECPPKGTLNGNKIARSELLPGDEIFIGQDQFSATRREETVHEAVLRGFNSK